MRFIVILNSNRSFLNGGRDRVVIGITKTLFAVAIPAVRPTMAVTAASLSDAIEIPNVTVAVRDSPEGVSATAGSDLPLTTTFTPPAYCFTDVSLISGSGYPGSYTGVLGIANSISVACNPCWLALPSVASCFPPGWNVLATFSPGVCPSGYYIARSSVNSIGTVSETVATCCPRLVATPNIS